jgi:hypothetical protein
MLKLLLGFILRNKAKSPLSQIGDNPQEMGKDIAKWPTSELPIA